MRIAVSSSTFRRPLAAGELTQLEWVERCASLLAVDGVLADVTDFPRADAEYVAQLRKVAVDLGLVPFGLDAAGLFDAVPALPGDDVVALASGFGAAVVRTTLPPPGEVPPATFVETVGAAKALSRIAKVANVTLIVAATPGTIGADLAGVKHLIKDVDSAWLRACPRALDPAIPAARERYPAFSVTPADDPAAVVVRASSSWVIVDAPAGELPWDAVGKAVAALRNAEAQHRLNAGR